MSKYFNVITGSVALKASSPAKKVNIKAEEMEFARMLAKQKNDAIGPDGLRVIRRLLTIADQEDYDLSRLSTKKLLDIYGTAMQLDAQGADISMAYMDYEDQLESYKSLSAYLRSWHLIPPEYNL